MITSKENIFDVMNNIVFKNKIPTLKEFENYDFPDKYENPYYHKQECIYKRHEILLELVIKFSFATPCKEIIDIIKSYGRLVEIGSGTGYWAKILQNNNTDIIATNYVENRYYHNISNYFQTIGSFTNVKTMHAETAIRKYSDRNILAIWPCKRSNWLKRAVKRMNQNQKLLLIHEGPEGSVATEDFYDYADQHFNIILDNQEIPRRQFENGFLTIFEKK